MDKKFDILSHPNIKLTEDGGALPYKHSKDNSRFVYDVSFTDPDNIEIIEMEGKDNEGKYINTNSEGDAQNGK